MLHYLAEKMLQQSILLNITFKHHYVNSTTLSLKNNAVLLLFPQFSRTVGSESLRPHELRHARPPCPSPTPRFTQTHAHWVSDAIQPSHPLSSPSPPAPDPSQHQVFSNESTLHMRWPKYWSFSFSISSKEIPGLISFRMDWLDLLAVQGTLKSLLQHHSSKASILRCSAFFHSPTLKSIHDHRKNHSLDQTDLCW